MSKRISDSRLEHLFKCITPDNFSSVAVSREELRELVTTYQLSQVHENQVTESVNCMCIQNTAGERIANPLCLVFHLTPAVQVMEQPMSNKQYSFSEVVKILENMGIDSHCGACMSVAFTGASSTAEHTCKLDGQKDDSEPLFTLRGQDWIAPEIVREWAYRSLKLGSPIDKVDGARRIADAMENWQVANDKRKVAD